MSRSIIIFGYSENRDKFLMEKQSKNDSAIRNLIAPD